MGKGGGGRGGATWSDEIQCREMTGAGVEMKPIGLYFSEMCRKNTVQSALCERRE